MEEWKEYRLGDVIEFKTGKLNSNAAISKGKYPFFTCSPEVLSINEYAFDQKAILLAGNNAEGNFNIKYYEGKFNAYQRTYVINPTTENVDIKYLYYCLGLSLKSLKSVSQGTSTKFLTATIINNLPIKLPSIRSQKQIVSILSSLDDKIELNRRINENLEQQTQALFKSWFVDFEPFKDGKFVDSELGMIPEGWKVIETNKFMTISKESINPSKNPNCFYAHYSIPAFDEKSMPIFQYGNEIKSNKQKVSDNMTLVSKLNPRIKRIWFIDKACENAICSTEFIPYMSLNNSPYFLYCYLDSDVFYNSIMGSVNGATGSHQRFQANDTLKFLFPYNEEVIYKFNLVVSGILKHKSRLIIENQKLSQLRDTLLPRLMSGKLEIKDNSYD